MFEYLDPVLGFKDRRFDPLDINLDPVGDAAVH